MVNLVVSVVRNFTTNDKSRKKKHIFAFAPYKVLIKHKVMRPNTLLAFIGGALAGAVVALLYAPDKGENIRRKIKERAEDEYNSLRTKMKGEECCHTAKEESAAE